MDDVMHCNLPAQPPRRRSSRALRALLVTQLLTLALLSGGPVQARRGAGARETAAQQLVRYLEVEGVRKVYGVPGEETLHIVDAMRKSKKVEFVLADSEQNAALMATGYARATGKLGVCLSTLGPGATNLVTGATNALSEGIRLLLITGQGPVKRPNGYHQKISLTRLFRPVTRLSLEAKRSSTVLSTARRLITAANKRPGPVHLSLPADVAAGKVATRSRIARAPRPRRRPPTAAALRKAAKLLRSAKFPVIVAGDAILRENADRTARAVIAFAKAHKLPIVPSTIAKGMFPWGNAAVAPPLDAFAKGKGADVVRKADLILSVGYHPTETFDPKKFNAKDRAKVIQLNPERLTASQRIEGMRPKVEINSRLTTSLRALHKALAGFRAPATVMRHLRQVRKTHDAQLAAFARARGKPLKPQRVISELKKALGKGGNHVVFADIGINKGMMTQWFRVDRSRELVLSNGMSTMGIAVPSAVGAKVAQPGRKVVSVSGDGGFLMTANAISVAASRKLGTAHIVFLDGNLGLIENHMRRNALKPSGVALPRYDLVALAKGLGAKGKIVRDVKQLAPLIRKALRGKRPVVIGVPVDYSDVHAAADAIGKELKRSQRRSRARKPKSTRTRVARRAAPRRSKRRAPGRRRAARRR